MNKKSEKNIYAELLRIKKVSDMLCTGHASLKDKYSTQSLILDIFIFSISTALITTVFIDENIAKFFTVFNWDSKIWFGILSVLLFLASIVQLLVNWKEKSNSHERALKTYSQIKIELGYYLAQHSEKNNDKESYNRILFQYNLAAETCASIPEKYFNKLKRKHRVKVLISKYLDINPGAMVIFIELYVFLKGIKRLICKGITF